MQIRAGYEIAYECPQPTPMLLVLSVHPSRRPDLADAAPDAALRSAASRPATTATASATSARASSRRPGGPRISTDFLIDDTGLPDPVAPGRPPACRSRTCPTTCSSILLGSRYCETDRLGDFAWSLFGSTPAGLGARAGDLRLRARPHRASATSTPTPRAPPGTASRSARRLPRLRAPRHHALPLHEHPGALLHRLSRRHRRAAGRRSDGFQRLVRGLSRRPLVHLRRAPQQAAHRPHPDGARPRRHRRRALHQLRPVARSPASRWSPTRCPTPPCTPCATAPPTATTPARPTCPHPRAWPSSPRPCVPAPDADL